MSNLYPGGQRTSPFIRIFDFEGIRRATRHKNWANNAENSIAKLNRWTGNPHEHKREIARRLRRQGR